MSFLYFSQIAKSHLPSRSDADEVELGDEENDAIRALTVCIGEFIDGNRRLPADNDIARLVRETREKKLTEISRAKVTARQIAEWMRKKHKPCVAFTGKRRFSLSY